MARTRHREQTRLPAAEGRDITEGEYRTACNLTVECTKDGGVVVLGVESVSDAGTISLSMTIMGDGTPEWEDFAFSVMGQCEATHSIYISVAYQTRAEASQQAEMIIAEYLPALIQCERDRGFEVPDEANYSDILEVDQIANAEEGTDEGCVQRTGLQEALSGR